MNLITWQQPDESYSYNQTLLYSSTAKYGTYTLLTTLTDIRTTKYLHAAGTSATWYKWRFYDATNYSDYSQPTKGTSLVITQTNYTTPKKVMQYINSFDKNTSEAVGTGTGSLKVFTLDYPSVVEDTEVIYVSGTAKIRNVDYTLDYDTGTITFGTAPILSAAVTADYWTYKSVMNSQVIDYIKRAENEINQRTGRTYYLPLQATEYVDSYDPIDTSPFSFEGQTFTSNVKDSRSDTNQYLVSRVLKMIKYPIVSLQQVITNAQPKDVTSEAVGTGDASDTTFSLANDIVVYGSEVIYLDAVQTTAYTIDYSTGNITFTSAPGLGVAITADYTYCLNGNIVASSDYLTRLDSGLILLKTTAAQIKQNVLICAVTYTYGYYETPALVEDLATRLASLRIIQSTAMGTQVPLSISQQNIGVILGEIRGLYESIGNKLEVIRL